MLRKKQIENFDFVCMQVVQCKILQIVNISFILPRQFLNKRAKKTKAYFDKIFEGITLSEPKKRFCVTVFFSMMDILSCQLINRFEGIKSVVTSYQVLEPSFLLNASHLDLEVETKKFSNRFSDNVSPLFPAKCSPSKRRLDKKLPI